MNDLLQNLMILSFLYLIFFIISSFVIIKTLEANNKKREEQIQNNIIKYLTQKYDGDNQHGILEQSKK